MAKPFNDWNVKKKLLDLSGQTRRYQEREIWWCYLGVNIGQEEDGKGEEFQRPVLILKGLSRETCLVVPLTSSANESKYRIFIGKIFDKENRVILSQIRVIDVKRLVNFIGVLDRGIFNLIRKSLKDLL